MMDRRAFILEAACLPVLLPATASAQTPRALTPEMFGARGDGRTNDTAAFAALSAAVNRQGGGTVVLSRKTYIVGRQRFMPGASGYLYSADPILEFKRCSRPLVIRGNGAVLRCADGLRFGTFDPRTGRPARHNMPYFGPGAASPYRAMVVAEDCSGDVEISDLELDGNADRLVIGGQWGDTGYQLPGSGVYLKNNWGRERLVRIHTHHHVLDGLYIDGVDADRVASSFVQNVRSLHNGRQGCSIVGGRRYAFQACEFSHTGRSAVQSAPGAGVDIEAEGGKQVRDLSFDDCRFSDNLGPGMLADMGPSQDAAFTRCTFIGTTSWSAWPKMPGFRFMDCTFVGAIVHAFGDAARPARAAKFVSCRFLDDPALSPNRKVYLSEHPNSPIAELAGNPGVLFDRCSFKLTHRATLPWSIDVTYRDCSLSQRSPKVAYPRGRFEGRNVIVGTVDLYSSRNFGELIVNGARQQRWRG